MRRRLIPGLFCLAVAAALAACSSGTQTLSSGGVPGIGPNLPTNTIYAVSNTQNALALYLPNSGATSKPAYQIGGSSTLLNSPQYDAFDNNKDLFVTNFNPATGAAAVEVYKEYALGNVFPIATLTGGFTFITQPHGVAYVPSTGGIVVANSSPRGVTVDMLLFFSPAAYGNEGATVVSGPLTHLSAPTGVAVDSSSHIFAANRGNGTITEYVVPSPTPVPSTTPSPSPTPTPTATPSANPSASPTPTPSPTPNAFDQAPLTTITGFGEPTGVAVDASGNVYVADPDNGNASIYVLPKGATNTSQASRVLSGPNTMLKFPSDVKVDSAGNIYVADSGSDMILIFGPNANGNVAPTTAIPFKTGTLIGLALSP